MLNRSGEAALAAVLSAHQLTASITDDVTYCGQWQEREPATARATFHLLASGQCRVESGALADAVTLGAGDLVIFSRGAAHALCSVSSPTGGWQDTTMLCGELDFVTGTRNPVLEALPECFVVRGDDSEPQFAELARLLCRESHRRDFGSRVVLDKLADALFVMAVRHYLNRNQDQRGLLAALLDAKLAQALDAMHSRPGQDWTVLDLARVACMSRTAFALRFSEVLGASPHQYLTSLRMTEALRLLKDPRLSMAAISERLGYQSEAAFRRSFKRVHGQGPGAVRRAHA
ncbi:MAG TPA: AraC family transcriptional regulator [Nevskiaceae bacterium]|nr:AraC family transcriptional regulator [Nevskiaceae bacterium]